MQAGGVNLHMSSISIVVSYGSDKQYLTLDQPDETTIAELKGILHEKLGVPIEAQKLIFHGKTLKRDDELVSEAGIKNSSRLMLLGRKTDPVQDELIKTLDDISNGTESIEKKINKIERDLEGIEKGFLQAELVNESCDKLSKQCLMCNENLMKNLESLDSVIPTSSSDTVVRGKRKTLVTQIQSLMTLTDQLNDRINKARHTI